MKFPNMVTGSKHFFDDCLECLYVTVYVTVLSILFADEHLQFSQMG